LQGTDLCADVQESHQDLLIQLTLVNSVENPDIISDYDDIEEGSVFAGADKIQKSLPGAALLSNVGALPDTTTRHTKTVAEVSKLCLWIVFSLCDLSERDADTANVACEQRPRHHYKIQQVDLPDG